ncbi:MAG TPA: transcriptional repressor [Myxococcota bacterium]|jgi:Fur family ferric uptake transcriptional regulator|nr:transcriptional repressor [Myxococcota bacterium]
MPHDLERDALSRYLEDRHLKRTRQRDAILDVFVETQGHISSEDLFQRVRERHPHIGYTTVYRTMKILCEAGLAVERVFEDGVTRFEIPHEHHDHLVCLRCGRIVEFECSMIETAQERIAKEYGFRLLRHRHELYGHCPECRNL